MKIFAENRNEMGPRGGHHVINEPGRPEGHHLPPHERRSLMSVEFDEGDWGILNQVFGDEDTAKAAARIIMGAPPEIQILAIQLMNMIEEDC